MSSFDRFVPDIQDAILAAVPDPFFIFDDAGHYVQILGGTDRRKYHDGQHLIGKRIHDVMSTEMADTFVREINKAITAEQVTTYVYSLSAKDIKGSEALSGPDGKQWFEANISPIREIAGHPRMVVWIAFNITELRKTISEKETLISNLQDAAKEITNLRKILPICSYCKKIRDDEGYWNQVESYFHRHTGAEFSHGICQDCTKKHFPEIDLTEEKRE
ncbi:PAS domain-containing protein [Desulfopila aestuarii]|uniref:PAS fold-containing protein n=1 Tax=Desulfopila aestuarii DSM 18488 TaxID=1121416 RepID=A0A1M7Y651_9BACT|nr:PAS domain-containing protein [Desulfopila aestuarii]SHO48074.1 PAS fold-containing protein [Desulfopila aestuarii DSM 18488]